MGLHLFSNLTRCTQRLSIPSQQVRQFSNKIDLRNLGKEEDDEKTKKSKMKSHVVFLALSAPFIAWLCYSMSPQAQKGYVSGGWLTGKPPVFEDNEQQSTNTEGTMPWGHSHANREAALQQLQNKK